MSEAPVARYGRNPGWALTAIVAMVYGLLVAFGDTMHRDEGFWHAFTIWAGLVVLAIFVWCMVIPFVRWLGSTSRTRRG
ncbi:hypothetical protein ACF3NS_11980 [Arsenicicoccus cauae]|uniref:hypothetical protein n=1 Tax=Arsenicicoccus cauae TaxID=2663847 RepID=UPI00370D39FA